MRHLGCSGTLLVVWCGVVWCGVVWCGVVWCGVAWCGVGLVWCGVVWGWCGVVWHGAVWCGVVRLKVPANMIISPAHREIPLMDKYMHPNRQRKHTTQHACGTNWTIQGGRYNDRGGSLRPVGWYADRMRIAACEGHVGRSDLFPCWWKLPTDSFLMPSLKSNQLLRLKVRKKWIVSFVDCRAISGSTVL
jgi:hypothetical protein